MILSVVPSVLLFVFLSVFLSVFVSVFVSVFLSVFLSLALSVVLFAYAAIVVVPVIAASHVVPIVPYLPRRVARYNPTSTARVAQPPCQTILLYRATSHALQQPATLCSRHTINIVVAQPLHKPHGRASRAVLMLLHGWSSGLGMYSRAQGDLAPHSRAIYPVDVPRMRASSRGASPLRDADASVHYFPTSSDGVHEHLAVSDRVCRSSPRFLIAHSFGQCLVAE